MPKKKQKLDKLEMMRIKAEQERQLAWEDDLHTMHEKGLRIVILEGMYTLEEVQANAGNIEGFF